MSDPYVRNVGIIEDMDGVPLDVDVDYDTVLICDRRLSRTGAEEFARLFVAACWEAGLNARKMAEEAADEHTKEAADEHTRLSEELFGE